MGCDACGDTPPHKHTRLVCTQHHHTHNTVCTHHKHPHYTHRYYGLLAQRFCYINRSYQEIFEDCFVKQYQLIHRLETNKLRNVAKLFSHLLSTDAISWAVLQAVRITEDDTTSSSRIFIKVLFQVCVGWVWVHHIITDHHNTPTPQHTHTTTHTNRNSVKSWVWQNSTNASKTPHVPSGLSTSSPVTQPATCAFPSIFSPP